MQTLDEVQNWKPLPEPYKYPIFTERCDITDIKKPRVQAQGIRRVKHTSLCPHGFCT
jgi:hypothetical protein